MSGEQGEIIGKISIDLTLIDQKRCKRFMRKNGNRALFCDLVLIATPNSEWGEFAVRQTAKKEERANGLRLPFIGNGSDMSTTQSKFNQRERQRKENKGEAEDW